MIVGLGVSCFMVWVIKFREFVSDHVYIWLSEVWTLLSYFIFYFLHVLFFKAKSEHCLHAYCFSIVFFNCYDQCCIHVFIQSVYIKKILLFYPKTQTACSVCYWFFGIELNCIQSESIWVLLLMFLVLVLVCFHLCSIFHVQSVFVSSLCPASICLICALSFFFPVCHVSITVYSPVG